MPLVLVIVPKDILLGCAIFTAFMCTSCLTFRLYQHQMYKIKLTKLLLWGLFSIIFSQLTTIAILFFELQNYNCDDLRWCTYNLKLIGALYALHRACLYGFVVWRIELLKRKRQQLMLRVGKQVVAIYGVFLVFAVFLYTTGKQDEIQACNLEENKIVLLVGFCMDIALYSCSSWIFLRPLWTILKNFENSSIKRIAKKEAFFVGISLLSSLLALCCFALIEGISSISLGIDSSITTICLLVLISPVPDSESVRSTKPSYSTEPLILKRSMRHASRKQSTDFDKLIDALFEIPKSPREDLRLDVAVIDTQENESSVLFHCENRNNDREQEITDVTLQNSIKSDSIS